VAKHAGVKCVPVAVVGAVSLPESGAMQPSSVAQAIRAGYEVLRRPLIFDRRLEALQEVGSLAFPNCSLHQIAQGIVEHVAKRIARSIGVQSALHVAELMMSLPSSPLFQFRTKEFYARRRGKVSQTDEVFTPSMSGTQRLHAFRLMPFLLAMQGHSAFAELCATLIWYVDTQRRSDDCSEILYRWATFNDALGRCVDVFKLPDTVAGREFNNESTARARRVELLRQHFSFPKWRDEWHNAAHVWCGGVSVTSAASSETKHQVAKDTLQHHAATNNESDSVVRRDQLLLATEQSFVAATTKAKRAHTRRQVNRSLRTQDALFGVPQGKSQSLHTVDMDDLFGEGNWPNLHSQLRLLVCARARLAVRQELSFCQLVCNDGGDSHFRSVGPAVDCGVGDAVVLELESNCAALLLLVTATCDCAIPSEREAESNGHHGERSFAFVRDFVASDTDAADYAVSGCRLLHATNTVRIVNLADSLVSPAYVTKCRENILKARGPVRADDTVILHTFLLAHLK
jgi:hypothetical protein